MTKEHCLIEVVAVGQARCAGCQVVRCGSDGAAHVAGDAPAARTLQLARSAIDGARPGHLVLPKPAQPAVHVVPLNFARALERHIDHPALTR